ncbi:hypothetical protein DSECCO2_361500 [anaerobic digester metagenome]|uniref:hypothetical protein n=1 Tax=Oscillibacter ruminantium TaxID=1263547 RepID=UPI003329E11E
MDSGKNVTESDLKTLASDGKTLTVTGADGAKLVLDKGTVKALAKEGGKLVVSVADAKNQLTEAQSAKVDGRPVYDLTATLNGKTFIQFGGKVTVTLPYTLEAGEQAQNVTGWYLSEDGTLTEIPATFDAKTGLATFTVTHFSLYLVGV